jgi:predicted phage tail protein
VSIAAFDLDGATVLVGITRVGKNGSVSQEQHSGVASIAERETMTLIELACDDGEVRTYPFDPRSLSIAAPGGLLSTPII